MNRVDHGVTLIEILVAIIIVILVVPPLMLIIMESMRGIVASRHYSQALSLTQDRLEEWKNTTFNATINETALDFTYYDFPGGTRYNISSFLTTTTDPRPHRRVKVVTRWQEGGRQRRVEMETIIHEGW
jgi:Tfp pilus assembly protein PilV